MLIIQCHDGPMDFKLSTLCSGVGTGGRGQGANMSTEGPDPPPPTQGTVSLLYMTCVHCIEDTI